MVRTGVKMNIFTEVIVSVVAVVLILWLVQLFSKNKQFYKNIPSPPTLPIIGNALDFTSTTVILNTLERYVKNYGDIVAVQIGPLRKFLIVSDYTFLERTLSSMKLLNKSDDYIFLKPWLGMGLLTSDGPKWKTHRRLLTPAFHFQILEQFIATFESCSNKLIEKLREQCGKDSVDIYPFVTLCALDIIYESTMGVSINAQDHGDSDYVQSVKVMTKIAMERTTSPMQMYDLLFPLTRNYYKQQKALKILHATSNDVINKKREKLKHKSNYILEDCEMKTRKTFLDLLLDVKINGQPLNQEEIREEIDTFMFEGHDTIASAISFVLFCLANYPDVQKKAYEEQQNILGSNQNNPITYSSLQQMKYLEQVIKETLRLYPSVPVYGRKIYGDVEFDGVKLPQGDTIIVFAYGIQRNPKYFKNPNEFKPERFEDIDGKLPFAYLPFSAGPRNCIGQKFAMLEMKSTLSKILRTFELKQATPEHVLQLAAEIILKSVNGIKIGLILRK